MQGGRACAAILWLLTMPPPAFAQQAIENHVPPSTQASVPGRRPVSDRGKGLLTEPSFITMGVDRFDRRFHPRRSRDPRDGFYLELGNMITGAGFMSAGPGYRTHLLGDNAIFSTSGSLSVRLYRMGQASLDFPHLAADHVRIGAQTLFRDALQVNFYGLGNDSLLSNRTGYRLQTNDVTTYASLDAGGLELRARVGFLQPVFVGSMGRDAGYPDTVALFSEQKVPGLVSQPPFLHADVGVSFDTRNTPGHATTGGLYQVMWSGYADQQTRHNSFQRYEADASHYVPLGSDKWVLALHAATALSSTRAGHEVPFYLMPNLGGRNLRGYSNFRFYDRNMQAYSAESRWRLFSHVDVAAFVDAGSVAPTIRQLKFSDLKPSYGGGLRLHNDRSTMARLDVGHGAEGWRVYFSLNEPFRRTSQSNGWRAAAPYVP